MPEKIVPFTVGSETYNIPESEVQGFIRQFPNARAVEVKKKLFQSLLRLVLPRNLRRIANLAK